MRVIAVDIVVLCLNRGSSYNMPSKHKAANEDAGNEHHKMVT